MAHDQIPQDDAEQRLDDILRKALVTPPISNEEIVRRSKACGEGAVGAGRPHTNGKPFKAATVSTESHRRRIQSTQNRA